MQLIKILVFLLALFYLLVNVSWYDKRPKIAMIYRNFNGDFMKAELFPQGHGAYSNIIKNFDEYKLQNNKPDERLYRTFKPDWSLFYLHLEYIIHPRWKLDYRPYIIEDESKG